MGFSQEWDDRYKEHGHESVWPWSDLVSYVSRYSKPNKKNFCVLELGCGAGANIPFFLSLGVEYYAVDGSKTVIESLKKRFPALKNRLKVGDFTKEIPFSRTFDLIFDRASLTHNTTRDIKHALEIVYDKLNSNGKFLGIHWFSKQSSEYQRGEKATDDCTRTGYRNGLFTNLGRVHFSDKDHLLSLFQKFNILLLEHKISKKEIPSDGEILAYWNIVAQKHE